MSMTDLFDYAGQPKDWLESCNLCTEPLFSANKHMTDRYGYLVMVETCACGLVFLNPRMTAEAYAKFYDGPYRALVSAYHGREINAENIEAGQRMYARKLVKTLEPYLSDRAMDRLLDVGGSTGVVAEALCKRFELRGTVLDPSPAELERAKAKGLSVRAGTIESTALNWDRYEVVTICQTLDHLLNISGALVKLRKRMTENPILFADIVDYEAVARDKGLQQAIKIDHPYYLTPKTGRMFLERAGFEVLQESRAGDGVHVGFVCGVAK